ncbi:MAG: selenide, water dikinase SelD, partial [Gammaproteobacteria bacterium]
ASYGHVVGPIDDPRRQILCDPQTSGGLLVAVSPESVTEFLSITRDAGLNLSPIGELLPPGEGPLITVA